MKKLIPVLFLIAIASCGEKGNSEKSKSDNILEDLTFSVDTVVVDSKDEIIDLKFGMRWFDLSSNKKSLFLYDYQQILFQEIDLDKMVLNHSYPFEKEGPNGLGRSSYFQILPDGTLMIPTYPNSGIYNLQGEMLSKINLNPDDIEGIDAGNPYALVYEILIDPNTGMLYSLPGDFIKAIRELAVIDPKSNSGKMIALPEMDKSANFRIFWNSEKGGSIQTENYSLSLIHDKLFITNTAASGIYIYDPKADSLEYVDFPHKIIPKEKSGTIRNEVSTEGDFWEELKKVGEQISYKELNWDEKSSRFYRFASKSFFGEKRGDPAKYENYLLVYDQELNLLGESKLNGVDQRLSEYFWKDGKLYSYVNVEDELGFAVFTFNF
ncbi:DUF4221 family protein [Algoriphagus aquimarinus]|uniref:DUF4221 family protein n=1 Tax=Algoriphagus aquimarinus TaxID=237018 RepID=UPI0030D9B8D3